MTPYRSEIGVKSVTSLPQLNFHLPHGLTYLFRLSAYSAAVFTCYSDDIPLVPHIRVSELGQHCSANEPKLTYCRLDSWEQFSVRFDRNSIILIQENVFDNVVCQIGGHFVQASGGGGGGGGGGIS